MSLESWWVNRKIKGAYNSMSNDGKTSILGVVLAAIIGTQIDWTKVFHLDPATWGQLAAAVVVAVMGWLTNKPDKAKT